MNQSGYNWFSLTFISDLRSHLRRRRKIEEEICCSILKWIIYCLCVGQNYLCMRTIAIIFRFSNKFIKVRHKSVWFMIDHFMQRKRKCCRRDGKIFVYPFWNRLDFVICGHFVSLKSTAIAHEEIAIKFYLFAHSLSVCSIGASNVHERMHWMGCMGTMWRRPSTFQICAIQIFHISLVLSFGLVGSGLVYFHWLKVKCAVYGKLRHLHCSPTFIRKPKFER